MARAKRARAGARTDPEAGLAVNLAASGAFGGIGHRSSSFGAESSRSRSSIRLAWQNT